MAIPAGAGQPPQPDRAAVGQAASGLGTVISQALGASLPIAAIGSGLAYILGRAYLAAYYRELNIPLNVLDLNTVDHLFASTDTIVASLVSAIIIWSAYKFRDALYRKLGIAWVGIMVLGIVSTVVVYSGVTGDLPGLTGVVTGLSMGLLIAWWLMAFMQTPESWSNVQRVLPVVFVLVGMGLFVYLSFIAKELGSTQASRAGRELPVAVVHLVSGKEIPELFRGLKSDEAVPLKIAAMSKEFVYGLDLRDCENRPKVPFKLWMMGGQTRTWVQSNVFHLAVQADCSRIVAIPSSSVAAICYGRDYETCGRVKSNSLEQPSK